MTTEQIKIGKYYRKLELSKLHTRQRNTLRLCERQSINWLPFRWWLAAKYQLYDINAIRPYKLNLFWLEYRVDAERHNLDHEPAAAYGLWG